MKRIVQAKLAVSVTITKGGLRSRKEVFFPAGTERLAGTLVDLLCARARVDSAFCEDAVLVFLSSTRYGNLPNGRHSHSMFTSKSIRLRDGSVYEKVATTVSDKLSYRYVYRG